MTDTGLKLTDVKEMLNSTVYQDTDGTWKIDLFGEATTQERGKFKKTLDALNNVMNVERNASDDLKSVLLIKPVDNLNLLATDAAITSGVNSVSNAVSTSIADAKVLSGINALRLFKIVDNEGSGRVTADDAGATRGANSIDLQTSRSDANSQVAAGAYSVTLGRRCAAIKDGSVAIGDTCVSSGLNSVAIGLNAQARSANSISLGSSAVSSGTGSVQLGQGSTPVGWKNSLGLPGGTNTASCYIVRYTSSTEDATPREVGFSGSLTQLGDRMVFNDTNGVVPGDLQDQIIAINMQAVAADGTEAGSGAYSAFLHRRALFRSRNNLVYQLGGTQTIGTDFNFTSGSPNITFDVGPSNSIKTFVTGVTGRTFTWNLYGEVLVTAGNLISD